MRAPSCARSVAEMARKPPRKPKQVDKPLAEPSYAVIGIDMSLSNISGACQVYDSKLGVFSPVTVHRVRFTKADHWYTRMLTAAKAHDFIFDLVKQASLAGIETDNYVIGVEEPWPAHLAKKGDSAWLRQQAQIHGSFVGGLLRWGWTRVYEVNNQLWKGPVRDALGKGTIDKWDVKDWAVEKWGIEVPDIINTAKLGMIEQPSTSRAKPHAPNDIYDALGVMNWTGREVELALSLPY